MGTVYRAHDPVLDRDVAIKVISRLDLGEEAESRFRHEAQVVAGMDHPSIVPIYDLGVEEERLFFVMPVMEGTTLKRWMRQRSHGLDDLLEIVAQVAEGLDYSHQRQVIHRDVKPENVMVSREESGSGDVHVRARVMDFGLALRGASSRLTQPGGLPGTLAYLSPEQILSQGIDARSDLYSLATILYEGLTGEPPFSGSRYSLLYRIANDPPPPLDPQRVDSALGDLVLKCLAKRPAERPQTCGEVAIALREMRARLGSGVRRSPPAAIPVRRPSSSLPLVGREEPLRRLAHRLHETMAGESQLVLIGGEAGVGKTRLLEELAAMAAQRSVATLRGNFAGEGAFPLHGFGELVQDFFRPGRAGSWREGPPRLADLAADLLRLFPFLQEVPALREAGGTPDPGLSGEAGERTRVYELIARVLLRLADGRPLVALLEHLHVSEMGAEALGYLLRRLGPSPVLIAATYRGSELGRQHPLAQMLRGSEDPRVERLLVGPLDSEEHQELLASLLPGSDLTDEVTRKLFESSEGNPFFTQELVRWLLESGDLKRQGDGPWHLSPSAVVGHESLPETIRQAVDARLDSLPDPARRVLAAASVLGRSFEFADLEGVVEADLDEAVDTLVEEGLLEEDPSRRGDRLFFASGIVRDVLYRGLSRRRRRALHRRCAERLEARFAGRTERVSSRLVHHFSEGDEAEKTVHYALELARDALAGFGSEAAVRALRTALELVEDDTADGGHEAELRRYLAAALGTQGHFEAAMKEAARAVKTAERSGGQAASAALLAAEISWRSRNIEDTRSWVGRGCELARRRGETEVLRKLLTLGATLANLSGQYAEARAFREEAAALRRKEPRPERPSRPPEGVDGGTLLTSIPNPLTSFELGKLPTVEEVEVLANVFEPLLSTDADGHLVPRLAAEWRQEEEGRRFSMELREGVAFSDGEPLRAEDVKLSFERAARTGLDLAAPVFRALEGCEELLAGRSDGISGIEVRGERRVVFRLRQALPIFPAFLTDLRTAVTRRSAGGVLLGTGPFRVAGGSTAAEVRLERNPSYWRKPPRLDGVSFRVVAQAADVAAALEAGELDVGRDLLPEDLERLLRDERFRSGLREATMKDVYYLLLNGSGPLCSNREVRRALLGVLRPHDLVWRTLGRFAVPAVGLIPPGVLGHDPGRRGPSLSRQEAQRRVEESGVASPRTLRGIVHPLWLDRYGALTQAIFEEWRRLGFLVEVEEHDLESFLKRSAEPQGLDFRLARWALDYEDPDNFTFEMFHSHEGRLRGFVASSRADEAMEKARTERRPSRRQNLYRQIEDVLILEEAGVLPLFHDVSYRITGPQISRLRMRPSPPWVDYSRVVKGGPAPAEPSAPPLSRSAVALRVPIPGHVDSLDPASTFYVDPSEVVPNVFETLVRLDDSAHVVPGLAAELRAEDGSRRFRFRLRSNVRFHDGRRFSVRDVRYSFERLLRQAVGGAEAPLLPIRGARALRAGLASELSGLKIVSPRELLIELEEPLSFFPAMLTCPSAAIVPEGSELFGESWRSGTAGTGPFRAVSVLPGERIELEANPHYWRPGYPKCDRLTFEMGFAAESIATEFRAGRLLIASNLRPDEVESLRRDPGFAAGYRETPGISTYYLVANSRRGALADPSLRWAVVGALDVEGAVRQLGAVAIEAHGLIPPGLPGQTARLPAPPRGDASALNGLKLRALVLPAYQDSYFPLWRHLRGSLEERGVELEEVLFDGDESTNSEFDLVATRWLADFPDSDSFVSVLHSRDGVDGSLCGDERIDELIERGRRETDPGIRHATYLRISELARREALIVPLFHGQVYRFARPEVQGLRLSLRCPEVVYEELSLAYSAP